MSHDFYIKRCFEIAQNGFGNVAPNPLVGSVIVNQNKIIAEGYHQIFGGPHAEVNAINQIKNQDILKSSCLYVNLEPCAHFGKTPPCANLIIEKNIPEVVICNQDPFDKVKGNGIKLLQNAGVKVTTGILEQEGWFLNRRFFTFHTKKRPYIILKWAESSDGFISKNENIKTVISNEINKKMVHKWRSEEQAIMVGKNTALLDNPSLTVKNWHGKNPIRVLIDKNLEVPQNFQLYDKTAKTIVFNQLKNEDLDTIQLVKIDFSELIEDQFLQHLFSRNIQSIIIEGGTFLLQQFIRQNLWDEARITKSTEAFGTGLKAPDFPFQPTNSRKQLNNESFIYYNF